MNEYVLHGGDEGAARLRLVDHVFWPTTRALLRRVGLRAGMCCLDLGCGSGAVTLRLARRVGAHGRAVGLDLDEYCLTLARSEATRRGLAAVFRRERAEELREEAAYDLVYARFLLTHLSQAGEVLARMARAARPGGVVVVEDIDFDGHFCYPECPAFERYRALYSEVVCRGGGDARLGPRLPGLFLDAGLDDVGLQVMVPAFRDGPGKRLSRVTLQAIRPAVVAAGLADHHEIDRTVRELDAFAADPRTILSLPRIFQVWGFRTQVDMEKA